MAFTPFPAQIPPETITDLPEKVTPVGADELIISDSENANSAKKIQIANLPSSGGAGASNPVDTRTYTVTNTTSDHNNSDHPTITLTGCTAGKTIVVSATGDIACPAAGGSSAGMAIRINGGVPPNSTVIYNNLAFPGETVTRTRVFSFLVPSDGNYTVEVSVIGTLPSYYTVLSFQV